MAGVLAVAVWAAPVALAGVTSPLAFGGATQADTQSFASLSCPSTRLCVAVDRSGRIVSSTHPAGGAAQWNAQMISGAAGPVVLTQVSCPSTELCVAIGAGDIVASSADPTASVPTWRVTQVTESNSLVDHGSGLSGIACPTSSLCIVTDEEGDVITSTNPGSGQAAWTASHVDESTNYECIHYGQTGCSPGLGPVSCPSSSRCVALDFEGNELITSDPTGGANAWQPIGGAFATPNTFWGYLTCAPSLCLTAQYYDAGVYAQPLSETRPGTPAFAVAGSVSALACPSASLCLAGNSIDPGPAHVYLSTAPRTGAWRTVYSAAPGITGGTTISAISCPSTRFCVVADDAGRVAVGTPSPSRAQLTKALRRLISLRGAHATIGRIVHQHGVRATITAPLTGTLTITWRRSPAGGPHSRHGAGPVLASATAGIVRGDRATIMIKLTAAGRRLLSHTTGRLALIVRARLVPTGQPPVTATTQISPQPR